MAKQKKETKAAKVKKVSPFWKPTTPGEEVAGKFIEFQSTKTPDGKVGAAIVLDSGVLVPLSYSIVHSTFRDVAPKLTPGTPLRFVYKGKGGRSKTIITYVNGKEQKLTSAFEAIKPADVTKFFVK
jgi:hypothetical protein